MKYQEQFGLIFPFVCKLIIPRSRRYLRDTGGEIARIKNKRHHRKSGKCFVAYVTVDNKTHRSSNRVYRAFRNGAVAFTAPSEMEQSRLPRLQKWSSRVYRAFRNGAIAFTASSEMKEIIIASKDWGAGV